MNIRKILNAHGPRAVGALMKETREWEELCHIAHPHTLTHVQSPKSRVKVREFAIVFFLFTLVQAEQKNEINKFFTNPNIPIWDSDHVTLSTFSP